MRFDELDINDKIHICFKINDKYFNFEQTVINKVNGFVLVNPIYYNNKILSFKDVSMKFEIFHYKQNEKPICWYCTNISSIKDKTGKIFYYFKGDTKGIVVNRRSNFRVDIGLKVDAQVGGNKKVEKVILKDLSNSGFAIIVENEINNIKDELVSLTFKDNKIGSNFSLLGRIVRISKIDNERTLLGCRLERIPSNLSEYISIKQRNEIARKMGSKYQ